MTARQRRKRRGRGKNAHGPLALGLVLLFTVAMVSGLSAVGYVVAIAADAGQLGKPVNRGLTSSVYAANGSLLGYIQSDEISTPVAWARIPQDCKDGTVAIEDERFYQHDGVDYTAIVRAAVRNLTTGKTVQGGSTITMQLVRNLYIDQPKRDYKRKIKEAKLASELEQQHTKKWILDQYLNSAPYGTVGGQSAMGMQAASQTFFAKNLRELNLSECALLAGLPQAPTDYNPFLNPESAVARRNEVLVKMEERGYITAAQADAAIDAPLRIKRGTRYTKIREPYFFDYVKQRLIDKYGINTVRRGGLKIHTTIDPKLQADAREAINSTLRLPTDPSSAVVSTDPKTGYVKAMASSGGYGQSQFNLAAQGSRQPGSAFKTMVLVTALRQGIDPDSTTYSSHPIDIKDTPYGPIKVKTYDNSYRGTISITRATLSSDNAVYIQLDLDVGPDEVKETARMLGVKSKLNGYPAEGLGGLERGVSPLEMSRAYATISSGGLRYRQEVIEKVTFPGGKTVDAGKPKSKRVLTDGVAQKATDILEQNVTAGTGTGSRAYFTCPAAGKTGTTDNFRDAWFVGYTPGMSTAVWVGYPNSQIEMHNISGVASVNGGSLPTTIWGKYMQKAVGNKCKDWPKPKVPFVGTAFSGKYASQGKAEGSAYENSKDKYTEGKKKKKSTGNDNGGSGGGGNSTPKEKTPATTPAPAPQAPVDSPGAVAPQ